MFLLGTRRLSTVRAPVQHSRATTRPARRDTEKDDLLQRDAIRATWAWRGDSPRPETESRPDLTGPRASTRIPHPARGNPRRLEYSRGRPLNIDVGQSLVGATVDDRAAASRVVAPGEALAAGFVLIHPVVGGREKDFVRLAVLREDRGADTDADLKPLAGPRLEVD